MLSCCITWQNPNIFDPLSPYGKAISGGFTCVLMIVPLKTSHIFVQGDVYISTLFLGLLLKYWSCIPFICFLKQTCISDRIILITFNEFWLIFFAISISNTMKSIGSLFKNLFLPRLLFWAAHLIFKVGLVNLALLSKDCQSGFLSAPRLMSWWSCPCGSWSAHWLPKLVGHAAAAVYGYPRTNRFHIFNEHLLLSPSSTAAAAVEVAAGLKMAGGRAQTVFPHHVRSMYGFMHSVTHQFWSPSHVSKW